MSKLQGFLLATILLGSSGLGFSASVGAEELKTGKAKAVQKRYLREGQFEVLGAGCVACVRKIEMDLRAETGVELVKVAMNVQPHVVTVVYDMDKVKLKQLCAKIEKQGYGIRNMRDAFHSAQSNGRKKTDSMFSMPELSAF